MFVNRDYLDDNSQRVKNLMGGIMSSTAHDEKSNFVDNSLHVIVEYPRVLRTLRQRAEQCCFRGSGV